MERATTIQLKAISLIFEKEYENGEKQGNGKLVSHTAHTVFRIEGICPLLLSSAFLSSNLLELSIPGSFKQGF